MTHFNTKVLNFYAKRLGVKMSNCSRFHSNPRSNKVADIDSRSVDIVRSRITQSIQRGEFWNSFMFIDSPVDGHC